jgi:methyl coenzyme M reductase subunit D
MTLEVWQEEGIHEEYEITVSDGETKELVFFPYKMFHLDVLNKEDSANNVKVMINNQSLPQACTLEPGRGREFEAKKPKYWRVALHVEAGETATVRITATR